MHKHADLDFRQLVDRLPKGATITILSDSCHSGGLIDNEKEQIGPSINRNHERRVFRHRNIPFESILDHLSSFTHINTSNIATHLLELFGSDASMQFHSPENESEVQWVKQDEGILLSGCQANETSADIMMNDSGVGGNSKACGAFSNAIQTLLKENPEGKLSNQEIVVKARDVLQAQGFDQHPCLYCSDENVNATFLLQ